VGKKRPAGGDGGLRAFLDEGALDRAAVVLRRRLRDRPGDPDALRDLALVLRQSGDLEGAARVYRRLAEAIPGEASAARLAALLDGGMPLGADPVPVRFLRKRGFLPEERLAEVRAFVLRSRTSFKATAVRTEDGRQKRNEGARRSASCTEVGPLREWFDPLIEGLFPEMLGRLGQGPFEPSVLSCKLSAYHDGSFFQLHQDRATGVAATRKMGFLYYFDFPPRRFTGGELLLYDLDPDTLFPVPRFTNLPPEGNSLVVLPAHCWHEVLPVRCPGADWTAGRFTYSGWIHDAALLEGEG